MTLTHSLDISSSFFMTYGHIAFLYFVKCTYSFTYLMYIPHKLKALANIFHHMRRNFTNQNSAAETRLDSGSHESTLDINCLICGQDALRVIHYICVNHIHRSPAGAGVDSLGFACSGDLESARQWRRRRVSSRRFVDRLDLTAFC